MYMGAMPTTSRFQNDHTSHISLSPRVGVGVQGGGEVYKWGDPYNGGPPNR